MEDVPTAFGQARPHPVSSTPFPPTTNGDGAPRTAYGKRLSLSTASATPLPDSPQVKFSRRSSSQHHIISSPSAIAPPGSPLRRSSSSLSVDRRSSTPTLKKRTSLSSLSGMGGVSSPRSPRRLSSTNFTLSSSPLVGMLNEEGEPTPPTAATAASVAYTFFRRELDMHNWPEETSKSDLPKTVVVLHDSCYGHRYSRPKTSKATLASIVERPERLLASILGVATAYVRLGGRHVHGKLPPHPTKSPESFTDLPFRIHKTTRVVALNSPAVTNVHGMKWMEELKLMCDRAEAKLALNGKELVRPESSGPGTDKEEKPKFHEGDLYLCPETLEALEGAIGAVCEAVDRVFGAPGISKAFVCIRPPGHHCSSSYPSGFCWLNNVSIGISHASIVHGLTHAAIIDFDLHHGDGSQAIAWIHNAQAAKVHKNASSSKKTSIGYFSLHDINSYPCEMGDEEKIRNASLCIENAHNQTIWNVHLQAWKDESEFWELYESRYIVLIDKARSYLRAQTQRVRAAGTQIQPKAAIFLSSGFDASQWESPGMQRHKVNVPTEFYARFTRDVVKLAEEEGTSVQGRVISVLEGGYSDRALCSGVLSHLSGLVGADPASIKEEFEDVGLRAEMSKRIGGLNGHVEESPPPKSIAEAPYDPDWWALPKLEELEALVNPPPPPPAPKKPRGATAPTYTTPTQSFTAKIISSPKIRRSVSGAGPGSPRILSRPPSPPPPDVDWATAAHELSKLLIPTERQTTSWKAEDLSAEAQRVKRERQSIISLPEVPVGDGTRRSTRERKLRGPTPAVEEEEANISVKRENRRQTVGGAELLAEKASARGGANAGNGPLPIRPARRRMSVASSTGSANGEITKNVSSNVSKTQLLNGPSSRVSSRPNTSSGPKPTTSANGAGESTITVARRARIPNQTRVEPPKPRAVKKQSVSPPVPLRSSSGTTTISITNGNGEVVASVPVNSNSKNDEEVDTLTAQVKKITLHVPSKEEHEKREKQKLEEKKTAPKAARKPAGPKAAKAPATKKSGVKAPHKESTATTGSTSVSPATAAPTGAPSDTSERPTFRSINSFDGASNAVGTQFIPYEESIPQNFVQASQAPLQWMPVNQNTPPPMRKNDLPVFTAKSPIRFSKASGMLSLRQPMDSSSKTHGDVGIKDAVNNVMDSPVAAQEVARGPAYVKEEASEGAANVWDVPETPQK